MSTRRYRSPGALTAFLEQWDELPRERSIRWPLSDDEWTKTDEHWPYKKGTRVWVTSEFLPPSGKGRKWSSATIVGASLLGGCVGDKFAYLTVEHTSKALTGALPGQVRAMTALEQLADVCNT